MSKGPSSPPSSRLQFNQASRNPQAIRPQFKKAAGSVPPAIKYNAPAMNGPKPPANVRNTVNRQVRQQQARIKGQQKVNVQQKPVKQAMTRKTEFNVKARSTGQQFNQAARRK